MKLRPGQCFRRGVSPPTFFGSNTDSDTSTGNLNAPAGTQADDICIICIHTAIVDTLGGVTGYAHVTGSPLNYSASSRLHVMWKRATSGSNDIAALDAGTGWAGAMVVLRGCASVGTPFNAATTTTQASTTALSHVSVVAAGSANIVMLVTGSETSGSNRYSGITNATLNAVTKQVDFHSGIPDPDGGVGIFTGTLAGSGATGTWTATRANASAMGHISMAFGH